MKKQLITLSFLFLAISCGSKKEKILNWPPGGNDQVPIDSETAPLSHSIKKGQYIRQLDIADKCEAGKSLDKETEDSQCIQQFLIQDASTAVLQIQETFVQGKYTISEGVLLFKAVELTVEFEILSEEELLTDGENQWIYTPSEN